MVDPTLGGRIDYREVADNVDVESLVDGTRYAGDDEGVAAAVAGEFGAILGRALGGLVGYVLGLTLIDGVGSSDSEAGDSDSEASDGDQETDDGGGGDAE